MRITTMMRPTEPKANTTVFTSLDYQPPLRPFYIERVSGFIGPCEF